MRDPRLEGLWRSKTGSGYEYIAYGPHGQGSILSFLKDKDGLTYDSTDFFVTRTPAHDYLNLRHELLRGTGGPTLSDTSDAWSFSVYYFSRRGRLVVTPLDGDGFYRAVKQGKLRGENHDDIFASPFDPRTLLKDSSTHILHFIESSKPEALFGTPLSLSKISGL